MSTRRNRKLLASVHSPQEAREAVLGGARIIDSEDPKSALGNISPLRIMAIADATLDYARNLELQLSTNIGEDQLIFRRAEDGSAVEKSSLETAGKAAQAALGVAISMGTSVHPCSIVKVGLDGMPSEQLGQVLKEVVDTLRRTPSLKQCQVMSVLFAHDLELWEERKQLESVQRELVNLREFGPASAGEPGALDLRELALDAFRKPDGSPLFDAQKGVTLQSLKSERILPREATGTWIKLNELAPNHGFFGEPKNAKTTRAVIAKMVDLTVAAGADAMMLDTSILSKVCNIGIVDASRPRMVNLSRFIMRGDISKAGILSLEDIEFFVEYCHYRGIVANLAGSVESMEAQQLWSSLPSLDQVSARGSASAALVNPVSQVAAQDTRQRRTIVRQLVRGLAPPEHGGVLNVPLELKGNREAEAELLLLCQQLRAQRASNGDPPLETYYVSKAGQAEAIGESVINRGGERPLNGNKDQGGPRAS